MSKDVIVHVKGLYDKGKTYPPGIQAADELLSKLANEGAYREGVIAVTWLYEEPKTAAPDTPAIKESGEQKGDDLSVIEDILVRADKNTNYVKKGDVVEALRGIDIEPMEDATKADLLRVLREAHQALKERE